MIWTGTSAWAVTSRSLAGSSIVDPRGLVLDRPGGRSGRRPPGCGTPRCPSARTRTAGLLERERRRRALGRRRRDRDRLSLAWPSPRPERGRGERLVRRGLELDPRPARRPGSGSCPARASAAAGRCRPGASSRTVGVGEDRRRHDLRPASAAVTSSPAATVNENDLLDRLDPAVERVRRRRAGAARWRSRRRRRCR